MLAAVVRILTGLQMISPVALHEVWLVAHGRVAQTRCLSVKQRHLTPTPQALMQDGKGGIVGGTVGHKMKA